MKVELTDKQHLETMLVAIDASPRALERPVCRGWVGDWQITGTGGHVMTDGRRFPLYAAGRSARRWGSIKKRLGFCRLTQDGDDEGCFLLDRLPTTAEAAALREALGIRRRRHLSAEARASLERRLGHTGRGGLRLAHSLFVVGGIDMTPASVTANPGPRMISVLHDRGDCLGFLRANPRGFQAYNSAGELLGLFDSKEAAVESICRTSP